jgi:A/G-specific adenine glycosylase
VKAGALERQILAWYAKSGRRHLPWRAEPTPYRVVVSEFMLQQTQVERVIPLFERFVANFPDFAALAAASRADVVRAWKGLGYNSRAVRLHELARAIRDRHGGRLPADEAALRALPGVGPYTASAIRAFAFQVDVLAVDTNVRRIAERTQAALAVPRGRGFAFNSALMDLGATICTARAPKCLICPLHNECAAAPLDAVTLERAARRKKKRSAAAQTVPFERTSRYLRGRVVDRLRALPANRTISLLALRADVAESAPHHDAQAVAEALAALERDGLIERPRGRLRLRR